VGLAWFWPHHLQPFTDLLEPRIVVAVALFLMAGSLGSRSLYAAVIYPWPALWAVGLSYILLPAAAWSGGWLLGTPDLRVGLLLIASVPCTLASAVLWTRMAGGNDALALLIVLLTTATSWLATTAWLTLGTGTTVRVDTLALMRGLALVLIVPVGLGQLARAVRPLAQWVDRHKQLLSVVSRLLILCIVLRAAVDVRDKLETRPLAVGAGSLVVMVVLCLSTHLLALATGFWSSRMLGFTRADQIAVALGCSQKTLPVALYVFDAYFVGPYPLAVLPLVVYHIGQLLMDTAIALRLNRRPVASAGEPSPARAGPLLEP